MGEWVDVSRSSWLGEALYEPEGRIMRLRTKAGIEYEFQDVAPGTWEGFISAASRGRFVHNVMFPQHVKRVV